METHKDKWTCSNRRFHTLQEAEEFAKELKTQTRVDIYYNPTKECSVQAGYVERGEWFAPFDMSMELYPYIMHFSGR